MLKVSKWIVSSLAIVAMACGSASAQPAPAKKAAPAAAQPAAPGTAQPAARPVPPAATTTQPAAQPATRPVPPATRPAAPANVAPAAPRTIEAIKTTATAPATTTVGKAEPKKTGNVTLDPKLAKYTKTSAEVSGSIKSIGSDTMNNLMALWAEGFKKMYPNVQVEIEGKGSSTAPTALIAGTANFGPMSRAMKAKEIDDFEGKYGYKPTELATSIDMLAVYVHKDNPIKGLSLQQVDAIFSKTRKGGANKDITTWGDLGLTGEWKDKPISLYGRNAASGTYGYFKENALFGGDYKNSVKEQPGSSSVVQGIASDKYAIGYSGIGYKTSDVLAVPLSKKTGEEFVTADPVNAYSGEYPMARFLYVYINHKPNSKIDPLRGEFIKYMLSQEGQSDVVNDGYLPLTSKVAEKQLKSIGITTGAAE